MRLKGDENTEFEMKVAGYQFPHLQHEPYDSDWLNITVSVKHPRGAWSKTDACMLTFELAQLIDWLRWIADDRPTHSEESFMEPELRFEWFGGGRNVLRVNLDYSLRPAWSPYHGPDKEEELFVEFAATPEDLRGAAALLRDDLKKFPVRVGV
jgi:hypothetical protein